MQIQPQNNVNFNGKEHITSPQKLAGMIRHLESKGKCYKHYGDNIYWGKDLSNLLKDLTSLNSNKAQLNQTKVVETASGDSLRMGRKAEDVVKDLSGKRYGTAALMSIKEFQDLEKFSIGVQRTIKKWEAEQAVKKAELYKILNREKILKDELENGRKIGDQELRLKLKKKVLA